MGNVLVNDAYLYGVANALRAKYDTDKKYLPSEMADAVSGIQSGGLDLARYVSSVRFYKTAFPSGTDLVLEFENIGNDSQSIFFQGATGLKSIKLIYKGEQCTKSFSSMFGMVDNIKDYELQVIDFSEFNVVSNNFLNFCYGKVNLVEFKGELDLSKSTQNTNIFSGCTNLAEVRFAKGTIVSSLPLSNTAYLSDASVQSIIDGLATIETTQTLTLHKDVKAKLTEAQISQITSKNWTLA